MLRALLRERFQFVAREEQREQSTYALMIARTDGRLGAGLRRYAVDCSPYKTPGRAAADRVQLPTPSNGAPACGYMIGGSRMAAGGITMELFARVLRGHAGREVIDRTELAGDWEFTLDTANDVSVFTALREQLAPEARRERRWSDPSWSPAQDDRALQRLKSAVDDGIVVHSVQEKTMPPSTRAKSSRPTPPASRNIVRTLEDVGRRLKRANAILARLSDSDRRMEIIEEEHLRRDVARESAFREEAPTFVG